MKNNEKVKKSKKEVKGFFKEFKKFITRGNVLDLAVGVIIASAFGKIVTSLVNDILMPVIGLVIGGIDFTDLKLTIKDVNINYGLFVQQIVDFIIVAFCIFIFVKITNKIMSLKEKEGKKEEEKVEVKEDEKLIILKEIRDLLKK